MKFTKEQKEYLINELRWLNNAILDRWLHYLPESSDNSQITNHSQQLNDVKEVREGFDSPTALEESKSDEGSKSLKERNPVQTSSFSSADTSDNTKCKICNKTFDEHIKSYNPLVDGEYSYYCYKPSEVDEKKWGDSFERQISDNTNSQQGSDKGKDLESSSGNKNSCCSDNPADTSDNTKKAKEVQND